MEVGAVAAMRYVKDGIRAARLVMEHTKHTLLVGEKASAFAIAMGLPGPSNLSSTESLEKWNKWKENGCQPNFWKNVVPLNGCGPYHPKSEKGFSEGGYSEANLMGVIEPRSSHFGLHSHDTISMAVIDKVSSLDMPLVYIIRMHVFLFHSKNCFAHVDGTYCCWHIN